MSNASQAILLQASCKLPPTVATMPNALYHSLKGQYFVGYADNLFFEQDKSAWVALANPVHSGKLLFVNVWTVTQGLGSPVTIEIWFNAKLPGEYTVSPFVTPADTAIHPLPKPRVMILQASNVIGQPEGGAKAFIRRSIPGETMVSEEEGKFVIPPGGSFAIFLTHPEGQPGPVTGRVAYGWWEEPICREHAGKERKL